MASEQPEIESETSVEVKYSDYVKDLLREKIALDPEQHSNAMRLIDDEIVKAQAQTQGGKPFRPDAKFVDIYKEKPIKVSAKVLVPIKDHPRFNFVGKLLGPKGNSLKRLQEDTMTKMAILGRGSMRDKAKEEELRNSLDPKYSHLTDDLHVEISALGPPAEAYARIAFALAEIRKFMVPDGEEGRPDQMRDFQPFGAGAPRGRGGAPGRGGIRPPGGRGVRGMPPGRLPPPAVGGRPPMGKSKVMSILDRARAAMDDPYAAAAGGFDDGAYYEPPPPATSAYESTGYGGSSFNGSNYYESTSYPGALGAPAEPAGGWKSYGSAGGDSAVGGKLSAGSRFSNARAAPYARPK